MTSEAAVCISGCSQSSAAFLWLFRCILMNYQLHFYGSRHERDWQRCRWFFTQHKLLAANYPKQQTKRNTTCFQSDFCFNPLIVFTRLLNCFDLGLLTRNMWDETCIWVKPSCGGLYIHAYTCTSMYRCNCGKFIRSGAS